jgi:periplasmic protein TonB
MFEDSTFESTGRIRTRSHGWMIATLTLNSSILLALILFPLIYPEALQRHAMAFLMAVPPPPATPPPVARQALRTASETSPALEDPFVAPRQIPSNIANVNDPGPAPPSPIGTLDTDTGVPGGIGDAFRSQPAPRVVHPDVKTRVHVPSDLEAGLLVRKVVPQYPQLARAMRVGGTVVLAATISKDGTIANLRVVSGPSTLQQAALDAVSQWRYRPYLLNGKPVDVETTVNVIFTLGA